MMIYLPVTIIQSLTIIKQIFDWNILKIENLYLGYY